MVDQTLTLFGVYNQLRASPSKRLTAFSVELM